MNMPEYSLNLIFTFLDVTREVEWILDFIKLEVIYVYLLKKKKNIANLLAFCFHLYFVVYFLRISYQSVGHTWLPQDVKRDPFSLSYLDFCWLRKM